MKTFFVLIHQTLFLIISIYQHCKLHSYFTVLWYMVSVFPFENLYKYRFGIRENGNIGLYSVLSVFCQALFPEKSVGIPCFQQGIFSISSGHYASLRMRACSIR